MKTAQITRHRQKFDVLAMTRQAQFAVMTLKTGEASDEEVSNEHPRSEQWLLVISGTGTDPLPEI